MIVAIYQSERVIWNHIEGSDPFAIHRGRVCNFEPIAESERWAMGFRTRVAAALEPDWQAYVPPGSVLLRNRQGMLMLRVNGGFLDAYLLDAEGTLMFARFDAYGLRLVKDLKVIAASERPGSPRPEARARPWAGRGGHRPRPYRDTGSRARNQRHRQRSARSRVSSSTSGPTPTPGSADGDGAGGRPRRGGSGSSVVRVQTRRR